MESNNETVSKGFWERMRDTYRLVVMNEETFEEVRSFQLSLSNVYLFLSSIVVVVAILAVLLIAYTPVKNYLPGMQDHVSHDELLLVHEQVEVLEKELEAQRIYANDLKAHILGEYEEVPDESEIETNSADEMVAAEALANAGTSEEERNLRRQIELERQGQAVSQQQNTPLAGSQNIPLEQLYLVAPIDGEVRNGFDLSKDHLGVDIIGTTGTAIKAASDGYVILSDYTYNTGYTIGVQHANNVITFYKHNSELLKTAGAFVKAGEAIAIIGNTGHQTTGPHLHFELWHKGVPVDPVDYFGF